MVIRREYIPSTTPGGYCFDLDLYLSTSDSKAGSMLGSPLYTDVYVLQWGSGKTASSFLDMIKVCAKYYNLSSFHSAWTQYLKHGGCTIWFTKFQNDDANIKKSKWWNKL